MSDQETKRKTKHVIFLGAGASMGSGYPSANELRLLMCSYKHFFDKLQELGIRGTEISPLLDYWKQFKQSLDLFRHGGFASVDEFCKLAGNNEKFSSDIRALKKLMRLVLCLHNPEDNFHKSEYYPFIQRLFKNDEPELRDDIVVLSFNYDPYLEYLISRAHRKRIEVHSNSSMILKSFNAMNSGFASSNDTSWADQDGFSLLKLHGTIAMPTQVKEGDVTKCLGVMNYLRSHLRTGATCWFIQTLIRMTFLWFSHGKS
jgi:hypothetical protein